MCREYIDKERNRALSSLIDIREIGEEWRSSELGDILIHQMQAPLETDLQLAAARKGAGGAETAFTPGVPGDIRSFDQLLHHPEPPLRLLRLCKEFGRDNRISSGGALPDEVAAVIYYAAIFTALLRRGVKITSLSRGEIMAGIRWVKAQTWIDSGTLALFDASDELSEDLFRRGSGHA